MKTSFYFVIWIIIYPLMGYFNLGFLGSNSFLVALIIVWGLAWFINKSIPDTLAYEHASQTLPILEDVYTGNVSEFSHRLSRTAAVATVTAIYFCVATIAIIMAVFKYGLGDYIALIIFGFITYSTVYRSIGLIKADNLVKKYPTTDECIKITEDIYKLDYIGYCNNRQLYSYDHLLPPRPKYFTVFQVISILFALGAIIFGIYFIWNSVFVLWITRYTFESSTVAMMNLLYGSLAVYFGISDLVQIVQAMSRKKAK